MPLFFRLIVSMRIDPQFRSHSRERDNLLAHRFDDGDACCVRSSMLGRVDGCTLEALPGLVSLRVLRRSGMLPHPVVTRALGAEWHVDDDRCWLRLTSGALGAWEPPEIAPRHHAPRSPLFRLASREFMSRGWGRAKPEEVTTGGYVDFTSPDHRIVRIDRLKQERAEWNPSWLASWWTRGKRDEINDGGRDANSSLSELQRI